jgi:hypothetical protein
MAQASPDLLLNLRIIQQTQKRLLATLVLRIDLAIGFDSVIHRTITSGPFAALGTLNVVVLPCVLLKFS